METTQPNNIFFQVLTNPALRFRLSRHALLWSVELFLIYRGFAYIALGIEDKTAQHTYATWSTIFFGGLTVVTYLLVTWLTRRYVLRQFRMSLFLGSLLVVHLVAMWLVWWHFLLFVHYLTLPHLPRLYAVHVDHVAHLAFWQVPLDPIIVSLISFSLFYNYLLYAVGFKVFKDLFSLKLQQTQLETENLQLEFNFLKAQINPHFLFNTLNNIYSFSIKSPEKVSGTILQLADLMRYALYETEADTVPLAKELAFLASYVQLQRIRHEADVGLVYSVQGQPAEWRIPPLLLIVFVENAFKHGLQASMQGGLVHINLTIRLDSLLFEVVNNIPKQPTRTTGGIGLNNVRKRLDHFYGPRYQLRIDEKETLFQVHLQIQAL